MSKLIRGACLSAIALLITLPALAAAQEKPKSPIARLKGIIDERIKGRTADDLSADDLQFLQYARKDLIKLGWEAFLAPRDGSRPTIADARIVLEAVKVANDPRDERLAKAIQDFFKKEEDWARSAVHRSRDMSDDEASRKAAREAVPILEDLLYVPTPADKMPAPRREGDARAMLGLWEESAIFEERPKGVTTRALMVLDTCMVEFRTSGELAGVFPYRLGRYAGKFNAIDFGDVGSNKLYNSGIFTAGESEMRIAHSYSAHVARPEAFVVPRRLDPRDRGLRLLHYRRIDELSVVSKPRTPTMKMRPSELGKVLNDVESIVGVWRSEKPDIQITFGIGTSEVRVGEKSYTRDHRINPLAKSLEIDSRALGLPYGTLRAIAYTLESDKLVLKLPDVGKGGGGRGPFDNPFEKDPPQKKGDDNATITLKRVVGKK